MWGYNSTRNGRAGGKKISRDRYRKGVAIVWFALLGFVLLGFVGLSLDWGKAGLNVHELHNGADASALAGAQMVKFDQDGARQVAIAVALENNAENLPVSVWDNPTNDPNGELVLGRWVSQLREFTPTTLSPNAVKVVGRRLGERPDAPALRLNWGPIFNTDTVGVARHAIAMSIGSTGAGIICLASDPDWTHAPTGLWLRGNGPVNLSGVDFYTGLDIVGDIQVNATEDSGKGQWQAVRVEGTVEIEASEINVVGATDPPVTSPGDWEKFYADPTQPPSITAASATTEGAPRVEDPLRDIPQPELPPIPNDKDGDPYTYEINEEAIYDNYTEEVVDPITGEKTRILTLEPGYYPGGIHLDDGTVQVQVGTQTDPDTGVETPVYETVNVELALATGTTVENSVYALGGGTSGDSGLVMTGGSVFGEGVTLFITGDPDGSATGTSTAYGEVSLGGNASLTLSAPGDVHLDGSGKRQIEGAPGVSIWQDRNNTNEAKIIGTSDFDLSGTLYFPNNHTEIGGTGFQAGNQLITGSLDLHGTGVIGIGYDGRGRIKAYRSILVE